MSTLEADTTATGWAHAKENTVALAGVVQWIECRPANRKVTSSVPSKGTCLGCRPGRLLVVCKRQLMDVSHT